MTPIKYSGQKITRDGLYVDMPMDDYHGQPCAGPSISSSGLRTIWAQSPAHYYVTSSLNPDRKEQDQKAHFNIGRAAHHLLLQGQDGFLEQYAIRPDKWSDFRTKDAKSWRDEMITAGFTILKEEDLYNISGMAKSLARNPLVKAGILDGDVERSLIFKDPETGVWLKSRPDCIPNASGDVADLKTTNSVKTEALQRTLEDYDYAMQGALGAMAFDKIMPMALESFTLVFVEKAAPWCVRVVTLTPEDMLRGAMQVAAATRIFAACVEANEWPGPGGVQQDAEFLPMREFKRRAIDERLEVLKCLPPETAPIREMELS
jgi:hypothetical protein